jgi:hypothetical protein
MQSLVQTLFDGPIDIVGDVHGEIEVLSLLMRHLGYDEDGSHREGRRLVFVGDLTDRGPDSPAVVRLVQRFIDMGRAQCVLGNHDLNILLGHRKFDNSWYFGEEFYTKNGELVPQVLADDAVREMVVNFFRTLPVALERPGVRVIHAFWDEAMIGLARQSASVEALCLEYKARIDAEHKNSPELDPVRRELDHQNRNPAKLLTSGPERRATHVVESSGKLRRCERIEWWREYAKPEICIFGHYGILSGYERGRGNAFCVDYAVGKRHLERLAGSQPFKSKLAALRLPERQVVFDDGTAEDWAMGVGGVRSTL